MNIDNLLLVFIAMSLTFLISCRNDSARKISPNLVNGVLDLKNWDFEKDGPINLIGEWEFYWEKHHNPNDFYSSNPPEKSGLIKVPGCWNGYLLEGKQLSGDGYATYRLKVLMNDQKGKFAFNRLDIGTAFTAYVNGEKISSAGVAGKTFKTTVPDFFPEVSDFISRTNQVEIILQISNFHHRLGGPWEVIRLGREKEIRKIRERSLVFDIFLCGSTFIIGLYHLPFFFLEERTNHLFILAYSVSR